MPRSRPQRRPRGRDERGMTTSEYAVGTIGACTVGLALYALVDDVWFLETLQGWFGTALNQVPGLPTRIGGVVL